MTSVLLVVAVILLLVLLVGGAVALRVLARGDGVDFELERLRERDHQQRRDDLAEQERQLTQERSQLVDERQQVALEQTRLGRELSGLAERQEQLLVRSAEAGQLAEQQRLAVLEPVSYTHLTLPTN